MRAIDRRRFLITAASGSAMLVGTGAFTPSAVAATDDELAFANFGAATELLLQDFYDRAGEAKLFGGTLRKAFARGSFVAGEHLTALSKLLTDSGQTAPLAEDFEFVWPEATFASKKAAAASSTSRPWPSDCARPPSSTRGLKIELVDERGQTNSVTFQYEGGIEDFVRHLNENKDTLHPKTIFFEGEEEEGQVEVAMQWNGSYQESIFSFANNINTHEGGSHLSWLPLGPPPEP